jgi:AraC-like DNA-binding protein
MRLAALCRVTPKSLQRFFRTQLEMSPHRWLDQIRDFAAAKLVLAGKRTKEIAYLLHYKHPSDFCHHFKRARGISVKRWKKQCSGILIPASSNMSRTDNHSSLSLDLVDLKQVGNE